MIWLPWVWLAFAITVCLLLWERKRQNLATLKNWLPGLKRSSLTWPVFLLQETWLFLAILCFGAAFFLETLRPPALKNWNHAPALAWVTWVPIGETNSQAGFQQQSLILGLNRELENTPIPPQVGVYPCGENPGPFCPLTTDYSFVSWQFHGRETPLIREPGFLRGDLLAMKSLSESKSSQKHLLLVLPNVRLAREYQADLLNLLAMEGVLVQLILLEEAVIPEDLQTGFRGKVRAMGGKVIPDGMAGQYLQLNLGPVGGKIASGQLPDPGSFWIAAGVFFLGLSCLGQGKFHWKSTTSTGEA